MPVASRLQLGELAQRDRRQDEEDDQDREPAEEAQTGLGGPRDLGDWRRHGGQPVPAKPGRFPYSNWGPQAAVLGVLLALGTGIVLGIPAVIIDNPGEGDLSAGANVVVQLATALGFLLVPLAIAARWGATVGRAGAAAAWACGASGPRR